VYDPVAFVAELFADFHHGLLRRLVPSTLQPVKGEDADPICFGALLRGDLEVTSAEGRDRTRDPADLLGHDAPVPVERI
jgi:hypothetical protein